jgi:hypothetical protein
MDLYGDPDDVRMGCTAPVGYVVDARDCDDGDEDVHPTATETCDGSVDHDCDGAVDEGCPCTNGEMRVCGDIPMMTGICMRGMQTCASDTWGACEGYVPPRAEECSDVTEIDEDCDGRVEEGVTVQCFPDPDGDGYAASGVLGATRCSCTSSETARDPATGGADCAPTDPAISPGATELCDGVDSNCDGYREDVDGDDHVALGAPCSGGPFPRDDCRDDRALVHPGQTCFQERPVCLTAGLEPCRSGRGDWVCGLRNTVNDGCQIMTECDSAGCFTYDYDCSGTAEQMPAVGDTCSHHPALGWSCAAPPACAVSGSTQCVDSDGTMRWADSGPRTSSRECGRPVDVIECSFTCSGGPCVAATATATMPCR